MKSLILLFAAIVGTQASAAKLVCIKKSHGIEPQMIGYLEINGLLDSEGLLEVRQDQPTMGTFISKPNHLEIYGGMNINTNQDPQAPNAGWKTAKLDSMTFRVRLERNQQTGEVQAVAAVPEGHVTFHNCQFMKEADDDEIVRRKMDELSEPLDQTAGAESANEVNPTSALAPQ